MAVMNVFGFDVLPGKALEFQDLLGRAVAVAMANGSPPPRIWQVALGGPNTPGWNQELRGRRYVRLCGNHSHRRGTRWSERELSPVQSRAQPPGAGAG